MLSAILRKAKRCHSFEKKTMTTKFTLILGTILFSSSLTAQTFSEDYFEFFKKSWEKEPTEEMKAQVPPSVDSMYRQSTGKGFWEMQAEQQKQSTLINIENYKSAFKLNELDIDSVDKFVIIEESARGGNWPPDLTRKGFVIVDGQTFSYKFNPEAEVKYKLTTDFLAKENTFYECRLIIADLAKDYDIEGITTLAKKEMELEGMQPKVEYEIVVYDQTAEKPLRIIYLHDFITEIDKK